MNTDKAKRNINKVMEQMKFEMLYDSSPCKGELEKWVEQLDDAVTFLEDIRIWQKQTDSD